MYSPFHRSSAKRQGKAPSGKHSTHRRRSTKPNVRKPAAKTSRETQQPLAYGFSKQARQPEQKTRQAARKASNKAAKKTTSLAKQRRKKLRWGRVGLLAILSAGLGYMGYWAAVIGTPLLYTHLKRDILQVDNAPLPYSNRAYGALSQSIAAYLNRQPGTYSVAGTDLMTGAQYGVAQNRLFNAAQTIALPVAITLYSDISQGLLSPRSIVYLKPADKQPGPGFIGGMPIGTPFTVTELAKAAITDSDIVATNMLIRSLGRDQINNFIVSMGGSTSLSEPHLVSPYDLSLYLDYLYTMDQAHPKSVAPLMADLEATPSEGRIKSAFDAKTALAHVLGDWPNEFHDAAIIWTQGHPVSLAIASDGVTAAQAAKVESQIARLVDQFELRGS